MNVQPRVQAGKPGGGQFGSSGHAEGEIELGNEQSDAVPPERGPLHETSRGMFEVVNATSRVEPSADPAVTRTSIHPGGIPEVRAATGIAALRMERAEQEDHTEAALRLQADKGSKATVLITTRSGDVDAIEGTLRNLPDGMVLMKKGSSTRGYVLGRNGPTVLAVKPGYGGAPDLAARFDEHANAGPVLEPATFDDLPVDAGGPDRPNQIAAVYVYDHPGFGGGEDGRGTLFFATDRDPDAGPEGTGIVNGYTVVQPGSGLTSEHGSMYETDLRRWGGRVAGYRPGSHTFTDAMDFGDRASVYGDGDIEACWDAVKAASA